MPELGLFLSTKSMSHRQEGECGNSPFWNQPRVYEAFPLPTNWWVHGELLALVVGRKVWHVGEVMFIITPCLTGVHFLLWTGRHKTSGLVQNIDRNDRKSTSISLLVTGEFNPDDLALHWIPISAWWMKRSLVLKRHCCLSKGGKSLSPTWPGVLGCLPASLNQPVKQI